MSHRSKPLLTDAASSLANAFEKRFFEKVDSYLGLECVGGENLPPRHKTAHACSTALVVGNIGLGFSHASWFPFVNLTFGVIALYAIAVLAANADKQFKSKKSAAKLGANGQSPPAA